MPWNPAVLEQRIGRIYRLGQKKHIQVYNFIAERSIEHRILFLLDFKKNVFKGVLDDGGEDTVMIEGFLQSVKAMIDVDMEDPAEKEPADYTFEKPFTQVAEANVMYQEDQHNNPDQYSKNQGQDGDPDLPGITVERSGKGVLSGFRYRLKRLAKRISNFLTGN